MPQIVLRSHYYADDAVDLSRVEEAHLQFLAQRLQSHGIVVKPLREEQVCHTEAVQQAYRCHNECRKQQPPVELRQEPLGLEKWTDAFVQGESAAPDLYLLARRQQEYLGVCLFLPNPDEPGKETWPLKGLTFSSFGNSSIMPMRNIWRTR